MNNLQPNNKEITSAKKLRNDLLVPKLRFKEFENKWDEVKLNSVTNSISSGKIKPKDNGKFLVYGSTGVIGKSDICSHQGENILIARVGANAGKINKVEGNYSVTDNTLVVDLKEEVVNNTFLVGFLTKFNLNRLIFGSGQPLITGGLLKTIKLIKPNLKEQQKIATFLTAVDTKIQQLGQKKELLANYKKGVMQQLFSQQLRFKNDDGSDFSDWERMELGDLLEYQQPTKYIVKSTEYNDDFKLPVLTAGKTFILGYTNEQNGIFKNVPVIIFDDFTTAFKYVDFSFKVKSSAMKILTPRNKSINIKYIYEAMKLIKFPLAEHKRYWISEYQYMKIPYPSSKEQQKIANYLSAIDKKIETVQTQIDKTQAFKKGLLQQMFV